MKKKSILIVDDEEMIRETFRMALEMEGFQIYTASNGKEALAVLNLIEPPALIFLDLMMPVMDGIGFMAELEKNRNLKNIPIVLVTAYHEMISEFKSIDVLKKPIDLDVLVEKAEQHCNDGQRSYS